jgi:hypothetical protein
MRWDWLWWLKSIGLHPKWLPIPYAVHYNWPGPTGCHLEPSLGSHFKGWRRQGLVFFSVRRVISGCFLHPSQRKLLKWNLTMRRCMTRIACWISWFKPYSIMQKTNIFCLSPLWDMIRLTESGQISILSLILRRAYHLVKCKGGISQDWAASWPLWLRLATELMLDARNDAVTDNTLKIVILLALLGECKTLCVCVWFVFIKQPTKSLLPKKWEREKWTVMKV